VAFASGGVLEWLRHGVNGLLAADRTADALGQAIADSLENEKVYSRLSAGALAAAAAMTTDAHIAKLERLFDESIR
jgi:glycosyltransferase involved in cell wall biosynthesis